MKTVICNHCSWVHFEVTAEYVAKWELTWTEYYPTLDKAGRANFGLESGPPTIEEYLHCNNCGEFYLNFRKAKNSEVPFGSTLSGILGKKESV